MYNIHINQANMLANQSPSKYTCSSPHELHLDHEKKTSFTMNVVYMFFNFK